MQISDHFFHVEGVAAAIAILSFAWGGLKGLYHGITYVVSTTKLVRHMYRNEIPHIQHALRRLCKINGIDYDDVPPPPLEL